MNTLENGLFILISMDISLFMKRVGADQGGLAKAKQHGAIAEGARERGDG